MNKIMFEMQAWALNYNFFASIDDGIVEYEIEENTPESGSVGKKGKLDKERSKLFIEFLELANINNIDELKEEERKRDDFTTYTDSPTFSISSFKYVNAFWNEYEEVDNMYFIYYF